MGDAEARTAYVAAVFRLLRAMDAFNASAFPLDPGSGTDHPVPWSHKHVAIAQALEAGWRAAHPEDLGWVASRVGATTWLKGVAVV